MTYKGIWVYNYFVQTVKGIMNMKTDVHKLSADNTALKEALAEAEKSAAYNGLNKKQSLQLQLLTEELMGMIPELVDFCMGEFWIENDGGDFELHASISADDLSIADKERLISVSKSGTNAAAKGIVSKIRLVAEKMLDCYAESVAMSPYFDFYDLGVGGAYSDVWANAWSLNCYRDQINGCKDDGEKADEWDELEKSVIANVADDVLVGVIGNKVDIVIKKKF